MGALLHFEAIKRLINKDEEIVERKKKRIIIMNN